MTSLAIFNRLLSASTEVPTFNLKCRYPFAIVSSSSAFIFSSPYPNHPAVVVYAGTARLLSASSILSFFPPSSFLSISTASSGVTASVIYLKSIHRTNSSGVISATMRQTGLRSVFAQRSQSALTTAPKAKWMTPFSGPIHLNWESETR